MNCTAQHTLFIYYTSILYMSGYVSFHTANKSESEATAQWKVKFKKNCKKNQNFLYSPFFASRSEMPISNGIQLSLSSLSLLNLSSLFSVHFSKHQTIVLFIYLWCGCIWGAMGSCVFHPPPFFPYTLVFVYWKCLKTNLIYVFLAPPTADQFINVY